MKNILTNHIKNEIGKYQIIYSEERNFIWYKNAKTAGTSMYRGIIKDEIEDIVSHKEQPKEFGLWWDNLTDEKINEYFTFTFVRNPFDRLVSAFNHVVMENLLRIQPASPLGGDYRVNLTVENMFMLFDLFVQRGLKNWDKDDVSMYSASNHWMPQSFFVELDGCQMVDFVGKYENLEVDWKYVADKIQVSDKLPFVGASNTGKNNPETRESYQKLHYSNFYRNSEIMGMVHEFYERDIELFNYKLEKENV